MNSILSTDEILNIFINRYYDYQSSQGHSTGYDDVQVILSDLVDSFSNGALTLAYRDNEFIK